jgi:hypothetical protein
MFGNFVRSRCCAHRLRSVIKTSLKKLPWETLAAFLFALFLFIFFLLDYFISSSNSGKKNSLIKMGWPLSW